MVESYDSMIRFYQFYSTGLNDSKQNPDFNNFGKKNDIVKYTFIKNQDSIYWGNHNQG